MPILDQGYQHWQGALEGHLWRWLTITRQGVRGVLRNRWVGITLISACVPALILALFLMIWGLFEQKSSVLSPFLFLFQGLPEELQAGPRGYRMVFWTLAFNQFLDAQLFFAMALVLLVGPDLISQDLRFNALPLYFSRPVRRLDYLAGKLGVIAAFAGVVMIVPVLLAYGLGLGFSLDAKVVGDTWRLLAASLAYCAIVVFSAGTLILAVSSLSRNSRYVGVIWVGIWVASGVAATVLNQTIRQEWCPVVSYTANLTRVRDALLDSKTAWQKLRELRQAGQDQLRHAAGRHGARHGPFVFSRSPEPPALETAGSSKSLDFPWQWSAAALGGVGLLSAWILAARVRSLDRLR